MAVTIILVDVGAAEGDDTGDKARVAFQSINTSLTNIKALLDTVSIGYEGQDLRTGASEELVLTNAGQIVGMDNSSPNAMNIPANSAVAFPVNTRIDVPQLGTGLTTITITDDTLIGDPVSLGQNKALTLWKKSATVWHVFGGTV